MCVLTPLSVIGPSGATEGLKVPCLLLRESGLLSALMLIVADDSIGSLE